MEKEDKLGKRYSGVTEMLQLIFEMLRRSKGMTLKEIQEFCGNCSRSTAERKKNCLVSADIGIGELYSLESNAEKYWGFDTLDPKYRNLAQIKPEDVANVKKATKKVSKADKILLEETLKKLEAVCRCTKASVEEEIDSILRTEFVVNKQKSNYKIDLEVLERLTEAIRSSFKVKLKYTKNGETTQRTLLPLGLVSKDKTYLIARKDNDPEERIATYSLHKISDVHVMYQTFDRKGFDLKEYSNRSFGVWQDETPMDVELLFDKSVAEDVVCYKFHPSQKFINQKDGSVKVKFTAGGKREIIWHLFTWGDKVKIIAPKSLKEYYDDYLKNVLKSNK